MGVVGKIAHLVDRQQRRSEIAPQAVLQGASGFLSCEIEDQIGRCEETRRVAGPDRPGVGRRVHRTIDDALVDVAIDHVRHGASRARNGVQDSVEHVLVEPIRRPRDWARHVAHHTALIEVVQVVLVGKEAVASARDGVALGEPDEPRVASAVVRGAQHPAHGDAGKDDGERQQGLRPLELGVVHDRRVADAFFRRLGSARRLRVALFSTRHRDDERLTRAARVRFSDDHCARLYPLLQVLPRLAERCGVEQAGEDGEHGEDCDWRRDEHSGFVRSGMGIVGIVRVVRCV